MNKIDARKLSPDALKALRSQAMRLRQELGLTWREIARVMGLNITTVFGWAQRYAAEGDDGLVSRKRGRTYLPPYAPQSNPDEYLNRDFKTQLRSANRCRTPGGLLEKATAFMQFLVSSPERVKSYFSHDSVVYAT